MSRGGYTALPQDDDPEVGTAASTPSRRGEVPSFEESSNWLSRVFLTWATRIVRLAYNRSKEKRGLEMEDLGSVSKEDRVDVNVERFQAVWALEETNARKWNQYIGSRVKSDKGHTGYLRFIGRLPYSVNRHELYAGVEWDAEDDTTPGVKGRAGRGDGYFLGEKIFESATGQGSFIKPNLIRPDGVPWSEPAPRAPSIYRTLMACFRWPIYLSGFIRLAVGALAFVNPEVVRKLVLYLQKPIHETCVGLCANSTCDIPISQDPIFCHGSCEGTCLDRLDTAEWSEGVAWLLIMGFSNFIAAMGTAWFQYILVRLGTQMRNAVGAKVYEKSMKIAESANAHPDFNVGNKVNLLDKDTENIRQLVYNIHSVWVGPLLMVGALIRLYTLVGPSVFAALGAVLVIVPIQTFFMIMTAGPVKEVAKAKDVRIRKVQELFEGIRIVKYMVWESKFRDELLEIREEEVHWLKKQQNYFSGVIAGILCINPIMVAACFIVYSASGHSITPQVVFPAQGYFQILQQPAQVLPQVLQRILLVRESFFRFGRLFESPDHVDYVDHVAPTGPAAVQIQHARIGVFQPLLLAAGDKSAEQLRPMDAEHTSTAVVAFVALVASGVVHEGIRKGGEPGSIQAAGAADAAAEPAADDEKQEQPGEGEGAAKPDPKKAKKDKEMYRVVPKVVLRIGQLDIQRGRLTMIIGPTGAGKTSLLRTLVGAMDLQAGSVSVAGTVAYCQQDAWLMNATVKENIVFHERAKKGVSVAEREGLYQLCLDACQLRGDLDQLESGDQTEIGERGITLSGGQKQRVSLARAVHADRDVYLLDDPISALDAGTGRDVMDQCVCGLLKGKTVVLVTQQVQYLDRADEIIMLGKDESGEGLITFGPGTYGEFAESGLQAAQPQAAAAVEAPQGLAAEPGSMEQEEFSRRLSEKLGTSPHVSEDLALRHQSEQSGMPRRQSTVIRPHHRAHGPAAEHKQLYFNHDGAEGGPALWNVTDLPGGGSVWLGAPKVLDMPDKLRSNRITHLFSDLPTTAGGAVEHIVVNSASTTVGTVRDALRLMHAGAGALGNVLVVSPVGFSLVTSFLQQALDKSRDEVIEHLTPKRVASVVEEEDPSASGDDDDGAVKKKDDKPEKLMRDEERKEGAVGGDVYWEYFQACGGTLKMSAMLLLACTVQLGFSAADFWFKYWSEHDFPFFDDDEPDSSYEKVYVCIIAYTIILNGFNALYSYGRFREGSLTLHRRILSHLLTAPVSFFDTTPLGRILNRFTDDIFQVDAVVPPCAYFFLMFVFFTIGNICVQASSQVYIIPMFVALGVLYIYGLKWYLPSQRELKRLDSINRSPVIAHFSQALGGQLVISAYGCEEHFRAINVKQLNVSAITGFYAIALPTWLSVCMAFLSAFVVFVLVGANVVEKQNGVDIDAALAALGVNYATYLPFLLQMMVTMYAQLEASMNSVERVIQYTDIPDPPEVPQEDTEGDFPPQDWPKNPEISFNNVSLRYREGLPLVVRELTFRIGARQKVGIVGGSGAGKSTILVSLFRFAEIAEGLITIGAGAESLDTRKLKMSQLRQRLSMVPQDPLLFRGTIASNLDPFSRHQPEDLWAALEKVNMRERIEHHDGKLTGVVTEQGKNFSVGERQLLCLARTMLKGGCRILLVDEATANIDRETDVVIQRTIRETFKDYTVITIAHRLQTIIDSDRIIVLAKKKEGQGAGFGYIAQNGTPKQLMQDKRGHFFKHFISSLPQAEADRLKMITEAPDPTAALLRSVEVKETS